MIALDDERALVLQAQEGDEAAFTAIVEQYQDALARHLARLTGDWALAEDLTQDTFIQAYRSLPQKQPDASLSAWLYRIATNKAIDRLRRRRLLAWVPLAPSLQAKEPPVDGALGERELVQQALAALSPKDRACLLLNVNEGLKYHEVAAVIGMSPAATRKRLSRAKEAFRTAYERLAREGR